MPHANERSTPSDIHPDDVLGYYTVQQLLDLVALVERIEDRLRQEEEE